MESLAEKLTDCAVVRAVSAEPAAYLTRLAAEKIEVWDVVPADECTLTFRVARRNCARALALAPGCCCDAAVAARHGFSDDLRKLRRRRVLCVLPLVLLALAVWSSFYVWRIEVTGNESVPTEKILNALEDSGVRIGAYWPAFTSDNIRSRVLVQLPELKWLSVSVYGSRAHVVVRETTPEIRPFDEKQAVRLVAALPGYIDETRVCRGFAKFQKGQAALPGETLVDGAVPDALGGVRFVHARGEIFAETYRELSAEAPMTEMKKVPAGRAHTRFALLFGAKRINFYTDSRIFDGNCDTIIKVRKLGVQGLFELPVAFVTETDRRCALQKQKASEPAVKQRLQKQLADELRRSVGTDGTIESAEYSFETIGGWALATVRARCRQNIAKEQPMTAAEIAAAQAAAKPKEEKKTE